LGACEFEENTEFLFIFFAPSTNNLYFTCYYCSCRRRRRRILLDAYAGRMDKIGEARHLERLCLVLEWNESEKGLGRMLMLPPGTRSAGTCRSAWRGGSSSSRTCAGGGKQQRRRNQHSATGAHVENAEQKGVDDE
jgi:hypothetical protein